MHEPGQLAIELAPARQHIGRMSHRLAVLQTLGRICFAMPMLVFGMEHFMLAQSIKPMVPAWLPAPMFWTYLVGVALVAASLSIGSGIRFRLSATLVAAMIGLFVVLIHVPNVVAKPSNRIFWVVACRDFTFAASAAVLAEERVWDVVRIPVACIMLFFGVEHFIYPQCVSGVPLEKITPAFVVGAQVWPYITGAGLVAGSVAMLFRRWAGLSLAILGALMLILVIALYAPILIRQKDVEGLNYFADTLMFAGSLLLFAKAAVKAESGYNKFGELGY